MYFLFLQFFFFKSEAIPVSYLLSHLPLPSKALICQDLSNFLVCPTSWICLFVFFMTFNLFLVFSSTGSFKTWLDCNLTFWQKYLIHFFTLHHITRCINVWFSPVDVNFDHRVKIVTARSLLWSCVFFSFVSRKCVFYFYHWWVFFSLELVFHLFDHLFSVDLIFSF